MKNIDSYYKSFNETESRIDYIKYGLTNEFGYNLTGANKEHYDEEKIIKKR